MTIYLLPSEQSLLEKLPADLRKGIEVVEEKGTAWESEEQQMTRLEVIRKKLSPELQTKINTLALKVGTKGEQSMAVSDFPAAVVPLTLLAMGATGITAVIDQVLRSTKTVEDVEALPMLTEIRHQILASNELVLA